MNLGWTSYDFKAAPMLNEAICKQACSTNPGCDFYTFIDSIFPKPNCYCGEFKAPSEQIPLNPIESVSEVTLKFKKGESYCREASMLLLLHVILMLTSCR